MKRRILMAGAVALLGSAAQGNDGTWITDWIERNGHQYRLTTQLGWDEAEALAVSVGGHLATINGAAENQWIADTFFPITTQITIGFYQPPNSPEPDGNWQWISGEQVTYTNWDPNGAPYWASSDVAFMVKPPGVWLDYDGFVSVSLVEVVPEPSALILLTAGGVALLHHKHRGR